MNTTTAQDLSNHFNELSSKVGDTRAMLKAIEAMLFESSGHDIERTFPGAGAAEFVNDLHCLVTIALDRARQAVDLADEFEPLLIALRWPDLTKTPKVPRATSAEGYIGGNRMKRPIDATAHAN